MDLNVEGKSERIPPGSHICQLYSKIAEVPAVTARLFQTGLSLSEKCFFAATSEQVAQLCEELKKLQVDVDEVVTKGQLVFLQEREPLLANGNRFDPYFLLSSHQTFIAQALRDYWQAVRISIDMTWLLGNIATPEQILKYEALADAVFTFQNVPVIALLLYSYGALPPNLVIEMLKLHPIAVVGKHIRRNPHYINSEQYMQKILKISKERRN